VHLFLRLGLLLLALAIMLPACDGGSDTAECPYCLETDFASTESTTEDGWPIGNDEEREYSVVDGEYVVTLKQPGKNKFMGPDLFDAEGNRLEIADSKISVTGRITAGDAVLGLVCRWISEPFQIYAFGVLENRYSVRGPDGESLARGALPEGTDLTQPTKLEANCAGDELTFAVDGTTVATVQDSRVPAGSDGVLLATNADATVPATVVYDDFEITEADE
jgi:hypothetical protein